VNQAVGTDFKGDPNDNSPLAVLTRMLGPISLSDMAEAWDSYGWEMALATLPGFVGAGTQLYTPTAADKRAQALGPNPTEKQLFDYGRVYSRDPQIKASQMAADSIHSEQTARQNSRDAELQQAETPDNWKHWREQRKADNLYFKGKFDQLYAGVEFKDPKNLTPVDIYNKAIAANTNPVTGDIDWDKVDTATAGLDQAYIKANTNLRDTEWEKKNRSAADLLDSTGYFARTEKAWLQVVAELPEWSSGAIKADPQNYPDYYAWRAAALQSALTSVGKTSRDVGEVAKIESWLDKQSPARGNEFLGGKEKDAWIQANPELAYLAWQMGYLDPKKEIKTWLSGRYE
jgi:hypothetical protein